MPKIREYTGENVLEAFYRRMHLLFREFDNLFVSFSGGKDSGLLLEMTLAFGEKYYPEKKIGVFHQDFEAQYTATAEYVERTFERLRGRAELYWVCLPMRTGTALSSYETCWYPWDEEKKALWVRPMPAHPYVIHMGNNPITTYRYRMPQEELARQFGRWYRMSHGGGKTVCLLGLRAEESFRRYGGFLYKKHGYGGECFLTSQFKNVWTASPLYDWTVSDVWHAVSLFGFDYNRLYDLYFMAGLHPEQMRVASPFGSCAKESLNLYRVLEPDTWAKLLGRVQGVNFAGIYGRPGTGRSRTVTLPAGHSWESYTKFLLKTLPPPLCRSYLEKFKTSIRFWRTVGGGLEQRTADELREKGYQIAINGVSRHTVTRLPRVIFQGKIPDDTDDILSTKDIPSWKRMCCCILKNDHNCRTMGFSVPREQQRRLDALRKSYQALDSIKDGIKDGGENGIKGGVKDGGEDKAGEAKEKGS